MKNRILKHYITTAIGVVIILATLFLVYESKTTLTEAGVLITLASALILSKDTLFKASDDNNQGTDNESK